VVFIDMDVTQTSWRPPLDIMLKLTRKAVTAAHQLTARPHEITDPQELSEDRAVGRKLAVKASA
jgi:hypothetical protein